MVTADDVASAQRYTGTSTVALGLVEQLSRRVERVGVFRAVVRADGGAGSDDVSTVAITAIQAQSRSRS